MTVSILFEIIILAMSFFSPEVTTGSFDIMMEASKPVVCAFVIDSSVGYDEEASYSAVLSFPDLFGDGETEFEVRLVDNALYEMTSAISEDPILLDIVPYLSTMDWTLGFSGSQLFYDSHNQELQIFVSSTNTVIFSPGEKLVLLFDTLYFN